MRVVIYTEFGIFYNVKSLLSYMFSRNINAINRGFIVRGREIKKFNVTRSELYQICFK